MPSCLGLYIENKLIKYAKVSVEKGKTNIENFGVEFYEDVSKTIEQIIQETSSEKTPISVNVDYENYDYFKIFSLLNKKDMEKAIATEVETIYFEKGITKNSVENRYVLSPIEDESDRLRVLNISVNKTQIMEKSNLIGKGKLSYATPVSVVLPNLVNGTDKDNYLVVNIENSTTFTSVINGNIYEIEKSKHGMYDIIDRISLKENSYSKAYKICKNTTIYTSDINETDIDSQMFLEDIMPTLYNVVQDMNKVIDKLPKNISKIYITGSAALINNIDLYFKEYVEDIECVILKPHFIDQTKTKINVKDYIEVNSALAMAYAGLNQIGNNINFCTKNMTKNSSSSSGNKLNVTMPKFDMNLKGALDSIEMSLVRGAASLLFVFIIYTAFSLLLSNSISKKNDEILQVKESVNSQITLANNDLTKLQNKISTYKKLSANLENMNNKLAESYRTKNAIPNLLYHIMNIIPVNVQITSIENTIDGHIVINAQTSNYQYLAYFTAGLKTGGMVTNVVSSDAVKEGQIIKVTIEGDLQ